MGRAFRLTWNANNAKQPYRLHVATVAQIAQFTEPHDPLISQNICNSSVFRIDDNPVRTDEIQLVFSLYIFFFQPALLVKILNS